jgi:hypothetical protein
MSRPISRRSLPEETYCASTRIEPRTAEFSAFPKVPMSISQVGVPGAGQALGCLIEKFPQPP